MPRKHCMFNTFYNDKSCVLNKAYKNLRSGFSKIVYKKDTIEYGCKPESVSFQKGKKAFKAFLIFNKIIRKSKAPKPFYNNHVIYRIYYLKVSRFKLAILAILAGFYKDYCILKT